MIKYAKDAEDIIDVVKHETHLAHHFPHLNTHEKRKHQLRLTEMLREEERLKELEMERLFQFLREEEFEEQEEAERINKNKLRHRQYLMQWELMRIDEMHQAQRWQKQFENMQMDLKLQIQRIGMQVLQLDNLKNRLEHTVSANRTEIHTKLADDIELKDYREIRFLKLKISDMEKDLMKIQADIHVLATEKRQVQKILRRLQKDVWEIDQLMAMGKMTHQDFESVKIHVEADLPQIINIIRHNNKIQKAIDDSIKSIEVSTPAVFSFNDILAAEYHSS